MFHAALNRNRLECYLALCLVWYFWIALQIPPLADDTCLNINDLSELWNRLHHDYFNWTGRILCMLILYIMSMMPNWATDLLTGSAFATTLFLLPLIGWGPSDKRTHTSLVIIATPLFLISSPAAGEILWWGSGATSYLYPLACDLLFLLPYAIWIRHPAWRPFSGTLHLVPLWLAAGIYGASTNENTGPALILLIIAWLIFGLFRTKRPPGILWFGLAIAIVASATLVLAPGNAARLDHIQAMGIHSDLSKTAKQTALLLSPHLIAAFILTAVAFRRRLPPIDFFLPASFLAASAAATGALVFAPYIEPRALTGPATFFLLAVLATLPLLTAHASRWLERLQTPCLILTAAYFGLTLGLYYDPLIELKQQLATYEQCRNDNVAVCAIKRLPDRRGFIQILNNYSNPDPDPQHWGNKCLARHYSLSAVKGYE